MTSEIPEVDYQLILNSIQQLKVENNLKKETFEYYSVNADLCKRVLLENINSHNVHLTFLRNMIVQLKEKESKRATLIKRNEKAIVQSNSRGGGNSVGSRIAPTDDEVRVNTDTNISKKRKRDDDDTVEELYDCLSNKPVEPYDPEIRSSIEYTRAFSCREAKRRKIKAQKDAQNKLAMTDDCKMFANV
jgi:hypothetical protein